MFTKIERNIPKTSKQFSVCSWIVPVIKGGVFSYGSTAFYSVWLFQSNNLNVNSERVTGDQQVAGTAVANLQSSLDGLAFGNFIEHPKEGLKMIWTIFVILLILWLVGMVSSYTMGGFIHLLLVVALVMLLINLLSGRRPVV
jgi:Family of unknown function (DUF5670)